MVYRYRLRGLEEEWQTTRERRAEYQDLLAGDYTFEVIAVDRDLVYSVEPATLRLTVHLPYGTYALWSALVAALGLVAWQTGRVVRRDRRLSDQNRALEVANTQVEEANRLKSVFLANMSHDLRTPMNAIIGYTRILLRRAKDALDDRQYRNLENIQTSADNLLVLINDILDLSKIEAGRIDVTPGDVDLRQLVSRCVTSVPVKPDVRLEEQVDEVDSVHTDGDLLRKVVMNVTGNAAKFTEQGSITVSLKPIDGWIELSVADTGPGIPAEDLPHIFDEFRQVDRGGGQEGTGLGLSIAKKSIELLGGSISAESKVGEGTTFTLRIRDYQTEAA